jgi:hypothetical protein
MYEQLSAKVDLIKEFRDRLESTGIDDDPGEVTARLQEFAAEVRQRYPDAARHLDELRRLEAELDGIGERMAALEKRSPKTGREQRDDEEYMELHEREGELFSAAEALRADDDLRFLQNIDGAAASFAEKHRTVHGLQRDKAKAVALFDQKKGQSLDAEDIREVMFTPFDVGIVLAEDAYDELSPRESAGHFLPGTPLFAVRERSDKRRLERTVRHERSHNLIDAVAEIRARTRYPVDYLRRRFKLLRRCKKSGDFFYEHERSRFDELDPRQLIDGQHDEIIAALEAAEADGFGLDRPRTRGELPARIFDERPRQRSEFLLVTGAFSTAGKEIRDSVGLLRKKQRAFMDDPDLAASCSRLADGLERGLTRVAANLKRNFGIAGRLGGEAEDDVHALSVLLQPSQYGRMYRFLAQKYSPEAVAQAERAATLVDAVPDRETLALVSSMVLSEDPALTDDDCRALADNVAAIDFSSFGELHIRTLEECQAYLADVRVLAVRAGHETLYDDVEGGVLGQFHYSMLERGARNDFKDLPELFAKLPTEEKEHFFGVLGDYLREFFWDDLLNAGGPEITGVEEIPSLPHWEAIRAMGLEERLRADLGIGKERNEKGGPQ